MAADSLSVFVAGIVRMALIYRANSNTRTFLPIDM